MRNNRPQLIDSEHWLDIEDAYIQLIKYGLDHEPMLKLIKHMQRTKLTESLFACNFMTKLVIGLNERLVKNVETLHVEYDEELEKWFFKYYPKPKEEFEFEGTYGRDLGIEKFKEFIRLKDWNNLNKEDDMI